MTGKRPKLTIEWGALSLQSLRGENQFLYFLGLTIDVNRLTVKRDLYSGQISHFQTHFLLRANRPALLCA